MMSNIHIERIKYMYDNQLSCNEVAKHFNVTDTTIRYSIKIVGKEWETKIKLMLKEKQINNKNNKNNEYIEIAQYMYENKLTYLEMAKKYDVTEQCICNYVKLAGKEWVDKINKMLKDKKIEINNNINIERAVYILENQLTYKEAAKHFKIGKESMRKSVKLAGGDWYDKINNMLDENNKKAIK